MRTCFGLLGHVFPDTNNNGKTNLEGLGLEASLSLERYDHVYISLGIVQKLFGFSNITKDKEWKWLESGAFVFCPLTFSISICACPRKMIRSSVLFAVIHIYLTSNTMVDYCRCLMSTVVIVGIRERRYEPPRPLRKLFHGKTSCYFNATTDHTLLPKGENDCSISEIKAPPAPSSQRRRAREGACACRHIKEVGRPSIGPMAAKYIPLVRIM